MHIIEIYKDIYTKRNISLTVTYNSHFSMLSLNLINRSKAKKVIVKIFLVLNYQVNVNVVLFFMH